MSSSSQRSGFHDVSSVPARQPRPAASLAGALDGMAFAVPVTLGSASLVYLQVDARLLGFGVFASLVALAVIHLGTSLSRRPVLYAGRFFEASTLAAMMAQLPSQLPGFGLPDQTGVRLAILCLIGGGAGIVMAMLYLVRADRFTRYIPAPVFAGIATGTAFVMLLGQTRSLATLAAGFSAVVVLSVALCALGSAYALRILRPGLPATAVGLAIGSLAGWAWWLAGQPSLMVSADPFAFTLPLALADWEALRAPGVQLRLLAAEIAGDAAILGAMVFVNTTLTSQALNDIDEGKPRRIDGRLLASLWVALAGLAGAAPLSGSQTSSEAAVRYAPLRPPLLLCCALVVAVVVGSGALGALPVAALSGALLCEAWFMVDRRSLHTFREFVRRQPSPVNAREDLVLVGAVTVTALLMNMVAAVFLALLLGLTQFAARNSRRPVRQVWRGDQVHSHCARPLRDLNVLAAHPENIRVFELEGDLFFGASFALAAAVESQLEGVTHVVMDWSRVHHVDSSLALTVHRLHKRTQLRAIEMIHAVNVVQRGNVAATLRQALPGAHFEPDLDRALEYAENQLILLYGRRADVEATTVLENAPLFAGLTPAQRQLLEGQLEQRFYPKGGTVFTAGEPSDSMLLVLHGHCSIVVEAPDGSEIRVAGVRRGATLGEMGFLDGSPRSATVIAGEDTTAGVLTRDALERLRAMDPAIVHCILKNLAIDLAARLRRANRLASVRAAGQG